MEEKSYIAINKINEIIKNKSILIYGENKGLMNVFKKLLKKSLIHYEVINFFQDEIIKNQNLLINEMSNISLFGKKKLFFVHEASDKILKNIEEVLNNNSDNKIIIFSNILEKKSKLRSLYEKDKNLTIIACYLDNEKTLSNYIYSELSEFSGLNRNVVNILMNNCNMDRGILNNEISKIKTCFLDKKIDIEMVEKLLNYKTLDNFDILRDSALLGNKTALNNNIEKTPLTAENYIFYIYSISSRVNKIQEVLILNKSNKSLEKTINELKPKIFWKDKATLFGQCNKWDLKRINKTLINLADLEKKIKTNSMLRPDILIKNFLVQLCLTVTSS